MATIYLSSKLEQERNPSLTINPSDFLVQITPPISLPSLFYEVTLVKLNCWNTVMNVINQSLQVDIGIASSVLLIPNGRYTVEDIDGFLQQQLINLGSPNAIKIKPNYNTNKIEIIVNNPSASLTLTDQLTYMLGFSQLNVPASVSINSTSVSPFTGQITNGINAYQVRTDIIRNSIVGGVNSDVITQFTPQVPSNANIEFEPLHLIYSQVNKSQIDSIRIRFTDEQNRLLQFNGEHTSVVLHLRPISDSKRY